MDDNKTFEEIIEETKEHVIGLIGKERFEDYKNKVTPNDDSFYITKYIDPQKNIDDETYNNLIRQINQTSEYLSGAIKAVQNYTSPEEFQNGGGLGYDLSDFINQLVKHQYLLEKHDSIHKNKEEIDVVKKYFGNYDAYARENGYFRAKTFDELEYERNERLAMLGELKAQGKISDIDFLEAVISVRRVYGREMQDEVVNDVLSNENQIQKKPSFLKRFVNKIKKAFKINSGKTQEISQAEANKINYKKELINTMAFEVLNNASLMLENSDNEEYKQESINMFNDLVDIKTNSFSIEKTKELDSVRGEIFQEMSKDCETTKEKDELRAKCLSIGSCYVIKNGRSVLKTQEELDNERNLVLEKYANTLGGKKVYVLKTQEEKLIFNNPENEQKYNDMTNQYNLLSEEIAKREPFKDTVRNKVENLNCQFDKNR